MNREQFVNIHIPIIEIFQSVSGEGISAGKIVVFVRVAGCNLRCSWCDTKYSFPESGESVTMMLPSEIVAKIDTFGSNEIICTGGEPLEEGKLKRILPAYLADLGYEVRIETSGASNLYLTEELLEFPNAKQNISYCMDVKCPGSGMVYQNMLKNITLLKKEDELKFVVKDETDLNFCFDVIDAYRQTLSENRIAINFSPVFEAMAPLEIVDFLKQKTKFIVENNLIVRISLQIHKYIWPPFMRGV
jgi:7-carboxy-7-deazaguanine synthase